MSDLVTNSIASSILDNVIEINETRRNLDSSADERRCFKLTPSEVDKFRTGFSYNVGTVSDGKTIRLDESIIYFRVPVNISMIDSQSSEDSYVYRASTRSSESETSLQVFVDGLKIPDSEVLFYPTKSNVDIFVPLKYVNRTNGSEFIVEKRNYDLSPYVRMYEETTSAQLFTISLNERQSSIDIKSRNVQIYVNKILYTGTRTITSLGKTMFQVSIFQDLTNVELEIIVDPDIQYFFPGSLGDPDNKVIFEVPESYIDSVHGPLSKFSCYFFIDGKRVLNTDIEQIGRLHFRYTLSEIKQVSSSMYVTDRAIIEDIDHILYGCDYYLYNMIGCSAITKKYKSGSSNTIFDTDEIEFDEVLNKYNTMFERANINNTVNTFKSLTTSSTKVSYLLENRPYLMRPFLDSYGNKTFTCYVAYNGRDAYVSFGLPETYALSNSRNYDISINTYHVPSSDIEIVSKDVTDVFKIDAKYFSIGENVAEITVIDEQEIEYNRYSPSDIGYDDGYRTLIVSDFKRAVYAEDIHVMVKVSGDENYNYTTDYNTGFIPLDDVVVSIEDGTVYILFNTVPEDTFIVYNSNFSCIYKYTKSLSSDVMDISIPLYLGGESEPVPYIPRGKILVYAGNEKLISGIDYFIKHPVNEETAAGSFLIIKRAILPGTTFDIYFSNMKTKQVLSYEGYFKNNPYGLFYLGNLNYPVSLKYLDIYINNKKITEADMDILSDKLIRIHSLPVPMYDLSIESTFTVEEAELQPYINLYEEDAFEIYIASLFKGVWFDRPFVNDEEVPDYNDIYDSFIETVDSVGKKKNPTAREEEWIPANNTDPTKIGVYNNGDAMGGEDINDSIITAGYIIFAGNKGRVCSCRLATLEWSNYNSGTIVSNDGSFVNYSDITDIVTYKSYVIFSTKDGTIGVYDSENSIWHSYNSVSLGIHLNKINSDIMPTGINKMVVDLDNESLYVLGDEGNVATYSFANNLWYGCDDIVTRNVCCISGIMGNIYDGYLTSVNGKKVLVCMGEEGKIVSCKIQDNAWTNYDGSIHHLSKTTGPAIYHDGSSRNYIDIYDHVDYLNMILFVGKDGQVSYFDNDNNRYVGFDESYNTKNVANDGIHSLNETSNVIVSYEGSILVVGSNNGHISNYSGEAQNWRGCNYGVGITDSGEMMDYSGVRSIVYTIGETNYIVFSGENGKVCTYNVDVHEVPYRYDPYKTAFLKWYTTPGNAEISTIKDIDADLARKFSMYHDTDSDDYDISVAPGDTDIISDIYMNDRGSYPREMPRRLKLLADFIIGLPEGRYTFDQVYELYMASNVRFMLYERDLVPLKGCSIIEGDEDIRLT